MRKIGLAAATLLLAGPVYAADMAPVYKAPAYKAPLAPFFSWTGCYIGADGGGAWAHQDVSVSTINFNQAPAAATLGGSGAIGGAYAGCNWQFAPTWVLGVEGDFSWTHAGASIAGPNVVPGGGVGLTGGPTWSRDLNRLASLRGRFGYALMPNLLLFGTGGVAWGHAGFTASDATTAGCPSVECVTTAFDQTKTGFVAGGGVDWAPWNNNWIFRVEYLRYQFSGVSTTTASSSGTLSATFNWGERAVDSVRAGVSYKF